MENNNRQGCRWVKASERLPEFFGKVHWRDSDSKIVITAGTAYTLTKRGDFNIEWLDESPSCKVDELRKALDEIRAIALSGYISDGWQKVIEITTNQLKKK